MDVLLLTLPFFLLVFAGYAATRSGLLPLESISGLNSFVLYFAFPAMLFRFGSATPIARLLDPAMILTYLVVAVLMVGLALVVSLNERIRWNDAAMGALVASFPNAAFLGIPLLHGVMGEGSSGTAIMVLAVDLVFTSSVCIALSRLDVAGTKGAWMTLKLALKGVLSNPLPWAILTGGLFSAMRWQLPLPLHQFVGLLSNTASPVALFAIGGIIARAQIRARLPNDEDEPPLHCLPADIWPMALMKLLVHPALVFVVGSLAMRLGVPLEPLVFQTLVLVAALPSAGNVSMLAERFDANTARIAWVTLISTLFALMTFTALAHVWSQHNGAALN